MNTIVEESSSSTSPLSATSRVTEELRRSILVGERKPGEKLKIEDLREQLGVGATPIREALSLLTSVRLVERLDQRGFRVAPADDAYFADILRTRCWLEGRALKEAVQNGDQEWEEALVLAHHRLGRTDRQAAQDPFAPGAWENRHKEFHMTLISACGSEIVLRYCQELYDLNVRYRFLAAATEGYASRDVSAEHAAIVEAALDRDADRAVKLLIDHYDRTGRFLGAAGDEGEAGAD